MGFILRELTVEGAIVDIAVAGGRIAAMAPDIAADA